ncbi:MAG: hypothetical protein ACTHMS_02995 [Jatrophihabitans sp.]|uniref:hypothetical protein n=1 Tax=Jatrophihabitans sp. TaxID=1932789 RepID=UPI003F814931
MPAAARLRGQQVLGVQRPVVTLTRVQSGVGQLTVDAVTASDDLRIGCAYELASGLSSTVQLAEGHRFAPPSAARRPVILAHRDEVDNEQLVFDLRQVGDLRRAVVYAFRPSGADAPWTGTLVTTTFAGARADLPLETLFPGRIAVLLSITNVAGELWVRAEMETVVGGAIREACRAYGFERITWRDDRTPAE